MEGPFESQGGGGEGGGGYSFLLMYSDEEDGILVVWRNVSVLEGVLK